jgi:hypothetical protein
MNELEELLQDTIRRSKHLWSHLNAMRSCGAEGLPIVLSNLRKQSDLALSICQTDSVRQETSKTCEWLFARQGFAFDNVLFAFGYSITEAQSLDCIRIALRADSALRSSVESSFGLDYVTGVENAGLVRRVEILLELGKDVKVTVPHMKDELRASTLMELSLMRNDIFHGPWQGLDKPIATLDDKLEYLKHSCIYLTDLVMLKYDLFRSSRNA